MELKPKTVTLAAELSYIEAGMIKLTAKFLDRFIRNTSGNVAMIFGLTIIPITIVAGFAIDFQLVTTKKTKAQYTLDTAIIAGTRKLQDGGTIAEVKQVIRDYYTSATSTTQGGLNCEVLAVEISDQDISASTICSQKTTLSAIAGIEEMRFRVDTATQYGIGMVDVAFVFDVSGSMAGSRMTSLKEAAVIAVDQLLTDTPIAGHEQDTRLAMVSYNNSMNAGDYFEAVTGQSPNRTHTYYDSDADQFVDVSYETTCVFQRSGSKKFTDDGPGLNQYVTPAGYWDRNDCRDAEPVPLTTDKQVLKDYIASLDPSGGTAGHLGVAWGWYSISPAWNSVFAGDPHPYDEPDTVKALILMTDGAFNATINNSQGSSTWQAKQLCDNIKDQDVVIYAVAFQAPSSGQAVLQYCSSGPEFYFSPENGQQLTQAYRAIATSISDLRLTM